MEYQYKEGLDPKILLTDKEDIKKNTKNILIYLKIIHIFLI